VSSAIQTAYQVNPDVGFAGGLARPSEPHSLDSATIHIASGQGAAAKPGYPVYRYSASQVAVPTNAAQMQRVIGILSYRVDTVAEDNGEIDFEDDDFVQFGVFGTFWVTAGSAIQWGQRLTWAHADLSTPADRDQKWDALALTEVPGLNATAASFADLAAARTAMESLRVSIRRLTDGVPIRCVSPDAASDGHLIEAQIGYGELF